VASVSTVPPPGSVISVPIRIRLFVDFWNLQILLRQREAEATQGKSKNVRIDWNKLPTALVRRAASILNASNFSYDGTIVFTSYDPKTDEGRKYHRFATAWLDRQPGVQVQCFERRPRHAPKCQSCHKEICDCPHCGVKVAGTVEKGVDTAIATDMIRLAWEKAYDVAVLVCSDGDLVPAVEFLDLKGVRVIQAGFPPHGSHLARSCWASFDIFSMREEFREADRPPRV
jgi:uncharacterized LabA/DUF88 family protein